MINSVDIFGHTLPTYGLLAVLGVCVSCTYALFMCKRFHVKKDDLIYLFAFGGIGAAVGAKILFLIVSFPNLVWDFNSSELSTLAVVAKYTQGGMVFYGGFLGAVLGSWLASKYFKLSYAQFIPILIPAFALAHSIARIGCLLVGCCYGIEVESPISIVYTHSEFAPNGVSLLPIQGIEACAEFIIFLVLTCVANRVRTVNAAAPVFVLWAYVILYGALRFVLEFFRGDEVRGIFGALSTSQWISLVLVVCVVLQMVRAKKRCTLREDTSLQNVNVRQD